MRGAESRAELITQLGFDTLAELSAGDAGEALPENRTGRAPAIADVADSNRMDVFRSAPPQRRKARKHAVSPTGLTQATLDELFAATSSQELEAGSLKTEAHQVFAADSHDGRITQLDFAALARAPAVDARAISGSEPAERGIGKNSAADQAASLPPGDRAEDGVSESLGASDTGVFSARRRRVILDEPEPETQPSRDFRITESHGVGVGGLHEKATANIAAIRLLKTLEEENREAIDEEKGILVRYAGWGALAGVFERDYRRKPEWNAVATELEQLLTSEEYDSARSTTPNAHFTSPLVIKAIWHGLEKLGLGKNSEALEPACGIGHFFGLMPDTLRGGHRTGVELDSITARIAKQLYPDATIFAKGFEETPLPDNYFDLVVGNPPFGDYAVHDPHTRHSLTRSIHDYFFAKSLEKLRPGGILAFITSRYTMDKVDTTIRKALSGKADLIAAVRLPNTTFKGNAGTEVTTDILFLQKRREGQEPAGERWTDTGILHIADRPVALNEYYLRHPEMMLGEMTLKGTMYKAVEPTLAGEVSEFTLRRALAALPSDVYIPRDHARAPVRAMPTIDSEQFAGIKDGAYAVIDGTIMKRCGTRFEPTVLSSLDSLRVRGLMQVRDAVREVFRTQLEDEPDEKIIEARQQLNRVYDQFVRRHGVISSRENTHAFYGDPDQPLLLSLEHYDAENLTATKSVIFERRTLERYKPVAHVETAAEALAISLNETGGINWERMAALTDSSLKALQAELDNQIFQTPTGEWETADKYLSGNVRDKLKTAEAAAAINPAFTRNVEALKAVQPADILPGDITARLGAPWIPKGDIADFIADLLHVPVHDVSLAHAGEIATWTVTLGYVAASAVSNTTTHGTKRISAADLIEDALNMRVPTIYDTLDDDTRVINQTETIAAREAQQKIKDRFAKWMWENPERTERLARLYNDTFNTIRLRTYDGSHLTFPGMNRTNLRTNDLDPHQKNVVWRILQNKHTLIGHVVGAGKTNAMAAACMELKRLHLAAKPMIAVPNHLVDQWGAAFLALYPQANIFVAGKDFFSSGNREKAMARIASGTYDAVIISHKSFESLPVSDETFSRFVKKEMDSLEEAIMEAKEEKGDASRSIVKQLEKAKKRLEAKIKDRAGRERKDDGVTFEQLGIDRIFVDEADLYKNLGFTTKMQRIAGLPNTESNRALDMYLKTRYIAERGGGIIFATGTPISNTMAEMYTLHRYLAPELLEKAGVAHFDAWAAAFGEPITALELAPDGSGYRMHTRFAKFVNLPELLSLFRTFADIQTADMLNLPRPAIAGGKPEVVVAPASQALKAYVSTLVERAQRIRSGSVDPRVDNMLTITTDGRKAALDMRLVRPDTEVGSDTKVVEAITNMYRIWEESKDHRLTQVAFCDISTPAPDRFNVYHEIRARLLERGIPEKEIAFIHDAATDAQKKTLFDSVNAGRIRILLGSTEKMGAGTNVQKKLWVLHHLDAPWRPRDIEQRDGRILRQGNENEEVIIYRYVTESSFDAYMWQTLETKQRFIQQVMSGQVTVREAEDLESGALSFAEIKAIASGNPLVMEKVRIDTEVRKLDMLRAAHLNQQYEIGWHVRELPGRIEKSRECLEALLEDRTTRDTNAGEEFTMTIDGQVYADKNGREEAGAAIIQAILSSLWEAGTEQTVKALGLYKGFTILSSLSGTDETPHLYLRGKQTYEANLNTENALGTIASIENALHRLDRFAIEERSELERREKALVEYMEQQNRPFEHEEALRALLKQQQEINRHLDLDKNEPQVVYEAGGEKKNPTASDRPAAGETVLYART